MDHKWGRNLFAQGLGDLGFTLCARVAGGIGGEFWLTNHNRPPAVEMWYVPTDTSVPYFRGTVGFFPGHRNFPYGWPVDADGPV